MKLENGSDGLRNLQDLLRIPQKILSRTDLDNITEFVLHELCYNDCLQLKKAAYFVDNPDFNYFRGIAGIDRTELRKGPYCIWDEVGQFSQDMNNSIFNQKVKHVSLNSPRFSQQNESELLQKIATDLLLNNHYFYTWDMRHGNQGVFLYEPDHEPEKEMKEVLEQAACILGFCPLF
jgi:hypothetical protein